MVVVVWLLALGDTDRRTSRLPTSMMWPGLAAVLVQGAADAAAGRPGMLAAALAGTAPYLVAHLLGQVGGGDVKLAFVVGGLLGDPLVAVVAVGMAQVVGLAGWCADRRRRRPHGPALTGVAAALLCGG